MTSRGVHKGQVYVRRQLVGEGYIHLGKGCRFCCCLATAPGSGKT